MTSNQKFSVYGMTCTNCVNHVEKAVSKVEGVKAVYVNLLTNSMVVTKDTTCDDQVICNAVSSAGYKAKPFESNSSIIMKDDNVKKLIYILISSIIFLIPLFYLSMGYMMSWPIGYFRKNPAMLGFLLFILSTIILIINKRFFVLGFKSVIKLSPTMDTLVALGCGVSYLYSLILLFIILFYSNIRNNNLASTYAMNLCFETAGMVPTLITVGKLLESYSKGKTTSAIKGLLDLSPKTIHILKDGKLIDINVEDALIGDKFVVRPGETIPLDGIITEGITSIDEKTLTGESIPIDKQKNDLVYCGTINIQSSITCEVTKKSNDTIISQIVKLVEEASSTKTKVSSIVDVVSFYFVPSIIIISLIVFILWLIFGNNYVTSLNSHYTTLTYAIERGVSVLVVSCPCALGLATPLSIMVGNGLGAKNGILFKSASAMEICGDCRYIVLDKTGTITRGKPVVDEIIPMNKHSKDELIKIAYSLERFSEHPLAKAINSYANINNIKPFDNTHIENIPGRGIKATINNVEYFSGNYAFLDDEKVNYKKVAKNIDAYFEKGKQVLIFFNKKQVIGIITLHDEIKEESKDAITNLISQGLTPIILSGDSYKNVENVAKEVGVEYFVSDILPAQKQKIVSSLQKYGKVIMVGDGINDAPSLSKADASMALSSGSDIAIDSGNIVLINSSLLYVSYAISLSRQIIKNIKENLFWAFFYNLIMIPIASGVFSGVGLNKLKPWMGSVAMAASSLFVCLNSLRLNIFDIKKIKPKKFKNIPNLPQSIFDLEEEEKGFKDYIYVPDMMCDKCVKHITETLLNIKGISEVSVSLETKRADFLNNGVDKKIIKSAIINTGYKVREEL